MLDIIVVSALISFAVSLAVLLVYNSWCAPGRRQQGKTASTPVVHPLAWHLFKECESERELVFGPTVPAGEVWALSFMCAKNNSGPTPEINVAVCDGHEWLCLKSVADAKQYESAAWSGELIMGPGWQLGCWFRGAKIGDVLQNDAAMVVRYDLM